MKRLEATWSPKEGINFRWRRKSKAGAQWKKQKGEWRQGDANEEEGSNSWQEGWRKRVGSSQVESLWEELADGILQEFVFDLWYRQLTPDTSAPEEAKRLLCVMFGQLATRAKGADLRSLIMRDAVEVLAENLEHFRRVKATIGRDVFDSMTRSAKERAIVRELAADGTLHPALCPGESEVTVLSKMIHPIVFRLLPTESSPFVVHLVRELLSGGFLRPVVGFCTPKWLNKALLMVLGRLNLLEQCGVDDRIIERFSRPSSNCDSPSSNGHQVGPATPSRFRRWREAQRQRRKVNLASNMRDIPIYDLKGILDEEDLQLAPPTQPASIDSPHDTLNDVSHGPSARNPVQAPSSSASSSPAHHSSGLASAYRHHNWRTETERDAASRPNSQHNHHYYQHYTPHGVVTLDAPDVEAEKGNKSGEVSAFEGSVYRMRHQRFGSGDGVMELDHSQHESMLREQRLVARVTGSETVAAPMGAYVVFTITVQDANGEQWQVSRRYKNFERLHRKIRVLTRPGQLKLPPKRLLTSSLSGRLVRDRRTMLDNYLKSVLSNRALAQSDQVLDFLSQHSTRYSHTRECFRLPLSTTGAQSGILPQSASVLGWEVANEHAIAAGHRAQELESKRKSASKPSNAPFIADEKAGDEDGCHLQLPEACSTFDAQGRESEEPTPSLGGGGEGMSSLGGSNDGSEVGEDLDECPTFEGSVENNAGLSAHLLRLIDRVFALRTIGAIQWTLYSIIHHVLSALHVDDRLDDILGAQVTKLKTEGFSLLSLSLCVCVLGYSSYRYLFFWFADFVVNALTWVRDKLWPAGVWCQRASLVRFLAFFSIFFRAQLCSFVWGLLCAAKGERG